MKVSKTICLLISMTFSSMAFANDMSMTVDEVNKSLPSNIQSP